MNIPKKILIVEDETVIAARISLELNELGYEVIGMVTRAEQALVHCEHSPPDIALLDINLKGEMDGIELAQILNERINIPIVFLTANSDEATFERAKKVLPYAFLSKPYKKIDLQRAVELVLSRINAFKDNKTDKNTLNSSYALSDRIFVRYKDKMVKVVIEDILYITADGNYSLITTKDQEYILTVTLKTLEESLPAEYFIRTHRSYVVNLNRINELVGNHETLTFADNKSVPISRRYKQDLLNRLKLF